MPTNQEPGGEGDLASPGGGPIVGWARDLGFWTLDCGLWNFIITITIAIQIAIAIAIAITIIFTLL